MQPHFKVSREVKLKVEACGRSVDHLHHDHASPRELIGPGDRPVSWSDPSRSVLFIPCSLATGGDILAATIDTYSDGSSPVPKGFGRIVFPRLPRAASSSSLTTLAVFRAPPMITPSPN